MAGNCRGTLTTVSISAGYYSATLAICPTDSSFGRLITISDAYDLYRFTKLRFTTMAEGSNLDYTGCISYLPSLENADPASLSQLAEVDCAKYFWSKQTTPVRLNISPAALDGGVPVWYKTRATSTNDVLEYQGSLIIGDDLGTANTYVFFLEYVIEFRNPAATGMTRRVPSVKAPD